MFVGLGDTGVDVVAHQHVGKRAWGLESARQAAGGKAVEVVADGDTTDLHADRNLASR